MRLNIFSLTCVLIASTGPQVVCAAAFTDPPVNTLAMTTTWNGPDNQFTTCALEDKSGWWWGTDNDGLWRYCPGAPNGARWTHIRAQDGLYDDSITALCCDRLGRLWVGTERRGVSVYNGGWWRNFDVMSGPLGVHVNAIALNPTDGTVWIASEVGIAIYSEGKKSWRYVTRADGLVSNDVTCLAFTPSGKVVIGTACDGLMVGDATKDCSTWSAIAAAPDAMLTQIGDGLPSNLIDCLLVNKDGKIFCGTSTGLGYSTDGVKWSYVHGWLWPEEISIYDGRRKRIKHEYIQIPLAEDYISCLSFDRAGHLLVGHRQRGCEVYDSASMEQLYHSPFDSHGVFLKAIVPMHDGGALLANYGAGLSLVRWDKATVLPEQASLPTIATKPFPAHPIPAARSTPARLAALASRAAMLHDEDSSSRGYFLGEDWMTQGDWVGRYGKDFAVLCAENGSTDLVLNTSPGYSASPELGHSTHEGEDVSHWLYWDSSGDPRVLFDPATGTRRQAEWNEHGERYSMMHEGPDLWITVQVPDGAQRISLYFMNKDGHTNVTRYRDYLVQLREYVPGVPVLKSYFAPLTLPVIAQTRVANFWPGVYVSFVVNGPGKYYVKIVKNYSLNAMLQGVFVDRIDIPLTHQVPIVHGVPYSPEQAYKSVTAKSTTVVQQLTSAWERLDALSGDDRSGSFQREYRVLLLRSAIASNAPPALLAQWRWSLGLWTDSDWAGFEEYMKRVRAALPPPKKQ